MNKLKSKMQFIAAVLIAAAASLAVTTLAQQQQPNTPFDRGDAPENAIEIPHDKGDGDNEGASGIETTEADPQGQWYWKSIYLHNNTGTGQAGPGNNTGRSASSLAVQVKNPENTDGRDASRHRRQRIVVEKVRKRRHNNTWTGWQQINKGGEKVVIPLDEPLMYCEVLEVRLRVEVQKKVKKTGSTAYVWEVDGNDDPVFRSELGTKATFNVVDMLTGGQKPIERAGAGSDPVGDSNGSSGEQGSVGYMFEDLDPALNLGPTSIGEDEVGTFAAPDLIFSERHSWTIPEGTLRFYATGGAAFSAQSDLEIVARDVNGEDALLNMDVGFGAPSVVNGVIHVPVSYRNPEAEHRIAIMVRGALVDVPGFAGGTLIRYAVGGISAGPTPVRMPPLLRVGADPENLVFRTHAELEVEYIHPEFPGDPGVTDHRVGWYTFMARPYTAANHVGYVDAIVIGEPEAGHIRVGAFEITPVDNFSFLATQDTKLYVVTADEYADIDGFDGGSIEVTASGALRVTLGARAVLDTPLLLVILNPKVDMGQGPFNAKQSGRIAIAGDALRGGLQRTIHLVECDFGTSQNFHLLPDEPLVATKLTPLAQVETD